MLNHPLHCECRHCTAERKIMVQNWALLHQRDKAQEKEDGVGVKAANISMDELIIKMKELTEESIEVKS